MAAMAENSVDAIVCDPPYGMSKPPDMQEVLRHWLAGDDYEHGGGGFMGKSWDSFVPGPSYWREAFRVLKPGAYCVAFSSTRTSDLLGIAMRLAGLERRDCIAWLYYSGFPKSSDISKALDAHHGAEREIVGTKRGVRGAPGTGHESAMPGKATGIRQVGCDVPITSPATKDAQRFEGYGTALKPSHEPALVFRKPLCGTYAENVLKYGTGGLNIDRARVPYSDTTQPGPSGDCSAMWDRPVSVNAGNVVTGKLGGAESGRKRLDLSANKPAGRWPANIYATPKASTAERNAGCEQLTAITGAESCEREQGAAGLDSPSAGAGRTATQVANFHPTLKPQGILRYLVRLVMPPGGGVVLDPFAGSGSLACAAAAERERSISVELDPDYHRIARARIERATRQAVLF